MMALRIEELRGPRGSVFWIIEPDVFSTFVDTAPSRSLAIRKLKNMERRGYPIHRAQVVPFIKREAE
jgi:hypothetical protein